MGYVAKLASELLLAANAVDIKKCLGLSLEITKVMDTYNKGC